MPARSTAVVTLVAAALAVAGCGGTGRPPRTLAPVRLAVDAPADPASVTGGSVEVSGTVWPAGTPVLVAGDEAGVSGRRFRATVSLDPGANVIDVAAGAPRRRAAMTAVRVTRLVPVAVPDVTGAAPGDAVQALRARSLVPDVQRKDDVLDKLFGGDPGVCGTDPGAGERVFPGTTVVVVVRNSC